jgi:hydrophobic/amphiphilic exporter-1 (mainly G- bacteria), HAE1 family
MAVLSALLILGALTLPNLRINLTPEGLTAPLIFANLTMETESTQECVDQLTRPAEEIARALPGVKSVYSRTRGGSSRLFVMPAPNVTLTMLSAQLSEAFDNNSHRLPLKSRPSIGTFSESDPPMVAVALNPGKYEEAQFRDIVQNTLLPALLRVPGVASITHNLEGKGSVVLAFANDRVTANKINVDTLSTHLRAAEPHSYNVPVNENGQRSEQVWRVLSPDLTQQGLADTALGSGNRIKNIAQVAALPSNYGRWILVDGKLGFTMSIYPAPDANSYASSREVTRVLREQTDQLGIRMVLQSSTYDKINAAAFELFDAALWGGLFSILFLLLFLGRFRLAFLVCASLPISLALAVLCMAMQNNSMNLFTLMGFILACGMVIDNAIVVGEAMMRVRQNHDPVERIAAFRQAVRGVSLAIVVSTLTTIALFLPVLVIDNPFARIRIMAIGEPIIWSLLGSLAVALIVVPMALPRLYPRGFVNKHGQSQAHAAWLMRCERWYGKSIGQLLLRPWLGFIAVACLIVPGLYGYFALPDPPRTDQEDNRFLNKDVRYRGNPTAAQLAESFAQWQREIEPHMKDLAISSVIFDWGLDRGQAQFFLAPVDKKRRHENDIEEEIIKLIRPNMHIMLEEHTSRAQSLAVRLPGSEKNDGKLGGDRSGSKSRRSGGDSSRGERSSSRGEHGERKTYAASSRLSFRLLAPDEESINVTWGRLREVFAQHPNISNPGSPIESPPNEIELVLSRNAEERGWRADQLAGQITRFAGTRQLLTMPDGVSLAVGPLERQLRSLGQITATEVRKNDGDSERFENLVWRRDVATQNEVRRRDGLSSRDFTIHVENHKIEEIRNNLPQFLTSADPPSGVQIGLSFWEESERKERAQTNLAIILSAVIIYLLMGVLYESILAPLALMLTVPIVYASVTAILKLLSIQIDNLVQIGLFLLIGVVVNHGVVLVDRITSSVPMTRLDRTRLRYPLLAIAAGSRRRFTPVVLTSLVTIAAAFPMIFGNGRFNGDAIAGLGASIAIGMTCALLFTLFVVPIVYYWLGALRAQIARILRAS